MFHYFKRSSVLLLVLLVIALAFAGQVPETTLGAPPGGGPLSISVTNNQIGITQEMVGAVEGDGGFDTADMLELGINNYRMYGGASRYEPVDDGGAYGSPTIAEIKADPNVINWSAWDSQFNRSDGYFWSLYGSAVQVSSATMLTDLKNAGIEVVMTVRPRDNNNTPTWIDPIPVYDTADRNEWWQHVFATVYYVNVLNDWEIDRWEVHNEPNQNGQGWADNGGSKEDYAELVRLTVDAIEYVYSTYLNNRAHYIHAPVLSGHPNRKQWTPYLLDTVDSYFDVFDYHWYSSNQDSIAAGYHDDIAAHNPDGVLEPLFNSEWGTYQDTYDSVSNALSFSHQLYLMNLPTSYVMGSQVFSLYPWGSTFDGLITTTGSKTETFWAFKTLIPAVQGGKANYEILGNSTDLGILGTKAADGTFYLAVVNTDSADYTITADVSAHLSSGTGALTEYSSANKAVVVANPAVSSGQVSFTVPAQSVVRLDVSTSGGGSTPTPTPTVGPTPTPGPTATPGSGGGTMHVDSIDVIAVNTAGPWYEGHATVTIVDSAGAPVSGATVEGTFSGSTSGSTSGATDANGQVTLVSARNKNGGNWTFCVDNVTKSGWTYDAVANVESCDSTP